LETALTTLRSTTTLAAPAARLRSPRYLVRDYAILLKPRVMSLVVFTAIAGMLLAPATLPLPSALIAVLCIAAGAGSAGAINMWYDRDIDGVMVRTMNRPVPAGRVSARAALGLGVTLAVASVSTMAWLINPLSAALLALTIVYYVFVYTIWLKRRTPQNIVIGGAAGALPPVIGWAAASGDIGGGAVALFLIIFLWTPPHSWALALFRQTDYARAGVPMMPVAAGEQATRRQILVYTALLVLASFAPPALGIAGWVYGLAAAVLGFYILVHAVRVYREGEAAARAMFFCSILYLFLIFVALLADRAAQLFG
jgi:protoheme IX farnesyltransferase